MDGDQILYIIAREGLRQGQLRGGAVGTLMSNMGTELALKQLGIPFARAKVGDRYVLEKLQELGWRIGAENSGHVILLDKTTTGDGIVAGLQVLTAMVRNHMSLHDLCSGMKLLPQIWSTCASPAITTRWSPTRCVKSPSRWKPNWPAAAGCCCANRAPNR